jgi:hypothetical protein
LARSSLLQILTDLVFAPSAHIGWSSAFRWIQHSRFRRDCPWCHKSIGCVGLIQQRFGVALSRNVTFRPVPCEWPGLRWWYLTLCISVTSIVTLSILNSMIFSATLALTNVIPAAPRYSRWFVWIARMNVVTIVLWDIIKALSNRIVILKRRLFRSALRVPFFIFFIPFVICATPFAFDFKLAYTLGLNKQKLLVLALRVLVSSPCF